MKIKNVKLEWYAFRYDSNSNKLIFINVLHAMKDNIVKKVRKGKKDTWKPVYDYETFKEWLKSELMYHYWSKSEYETVIGGLFHYSEAELEKHDIWWQLEPNLDRIANYINNTMDLKLK